MHEKEHSTRLILTGRFEYQQKIYNYNGKTASWLDGGVTHHGLDSY